MENLNHPIQHRQQQQRQKQFRKYRSFDHGHVGVVRTTSSRQSSNRETFRVTGYCSASEYNITDILDQWIGIEVERVLEEFDEGK